MGLGLGRWLIDLLRERQSEGGNGGEQRERKMQARESQCDDENATRSSKKMMFKKWIYWSSFSYHWGS